MRPNRSARCGTIFKYKSLAFYACEGIIALHDDKKPERGVITLFVSDFQERRNALLGFAQQQRSDPDVGTRENVKAMMVAVQRMDTAIKEAERMGNPEDPAVREWWQKHRPGRKSTISLAPKTDAAGYKGLPDIPLGNFTGRTAPAGVPLKSIHKPPRRKVTASGNLALIES